MEHRRRHPGAERVQQRQWRDDAAPGGYALVNARLGYRIDETWSAALNVNNLFDRRYYAGLFSPQWNNRYGEPRNLMFTVKAEF